MENIENNLKKAREYEERNRHIINDERKPLLHLTSPIGWINDPNGFSTFKGEYHLFCQYHVYDKIWGPMHWAHFKSKDMLKWEHLPVALAPDKEYDSFGCFSGTAIEDNGKHILMYTGVIKDEEKERQTQCIAIGDGLNYEKIEQNPVIKGDMLPKGSSLVDFRDPKIFKEDNIYYSIVANRADDGSGQIALFSSEDLKKWEFKNIILKCNNELGRMWECPDLFKLDDKYFLVLSPQEVEPQGFEYHGGNCNVFIVGNYDKEKFIFNKEKVEALDYGLDFYAPQTTLTEDGRRVLVGWVQSWENHITLKELSWSGIMSIPRELEYKNDRLYQVPIREIKNYYKNSISLEKFINNESFEDERLFSRTFDLNINLDTDNLEEFTINFAKNAKYNSKFIYKCKEELAIFDRNNAGIRKDCLNERKVKLALVNNKLNVRIIVDKYTVEIFLNDGYKTMTSLIYTDINANQISFDVKGSTNLSIEQNIF
ncbi:glycoside hydrolase family 32 protein [uncultured Tyzzerella sp.]|uniref:glycoside hydrolase family 32 protein n=1 Tax=uncultured Tyzzerella sp. TaxID=2321398 RepID=UPI002942D6F6|nr:glycoside hydrolase family 32 protein [uncultured Tyzzerella sp.]